jgi:hypothetical protein
MGPIRVSDQRPLDVRISPSPMKQGTGDFHRTLPAASDEVPEALLDQDPPADHEGNFV